MPLIYVNPRFTLPHTEWAMAGSPERLGRATSEIQRIEWSFETSRSRRSHARRPRGSPIGFVASRSYFSLWPTIENISQAEKRRLFGSYHKGRNRGEIAPKASFALEPLAKSTRSESPT